VKRLHEIVRLNAILLVVLLVVLQSVGAAQAQGSFQFLHLEDPGRLSLRLFAVGYGAEKYGTSHAGFELDQTITRAISIIGRVAAYQVYQGSGFDRALFSRCWAVKMRVTPTRRFFKTNALVGYGFKAVIR
jgi:hypothetical protein